MHQFSLEVSVFFFYFTTAFFEASNVTGLSGTIIALLNQTTGGRNGEVFLASPSHIIEFLCIKGDKNQVVEKE